MAGAAVVLPVLSGIGMPLLAAKVLTDLLLFAVSFLIQRALARPSAPWPGPARPGPAQRATRHPIGERARHPLGHSARPPIGRCARPSTGTGPVSGRADR